MPLLYRGPHGRERSSTRRQSMRRIMSQFYLPMWWATANVWFFRCQYLSSVSWVSLQTFSNGQRVRRWRVTPRAMRCISSSMTCTRPGSWRSRSRNSSASRALVHFSINPQHDILTSTTHRTRSIRCTTALQLTCCIGSTFAHLRNPALHLCHLTRQLLDVVGPVRLYVLKYL